MEVYWVIRVGTLKTCWFSNSVKKYLLYDINIKLCFAATAIATPGPSACVNLNKPGNVQNPNTFDCYFVNTALMSWQDAKTTCDNRGMTLASVGNVFDQAFLDTLVVGLNSPVWIGLADNAVGVTKMTPYSMMCVSQNSKQRCLLSWRPSGLVA